MDWRAVARGLWLHLRKYATVGLGSAAMDLVILAVLTRYAGWSATAANLVSRPCGGMFGFVCNKLWTFERRELTGTAGQLAKFWTVWATAYVLSGVLIWLFSEVAEWKPLVAKLAAEGTIATGTFLAMRFWTFRRPTIEN